MFITVGIWEKTSPDAVLLLPDQLLADAVATNNANNIVPEGRFDTKTFADFIAARGMLTSVREAAVGMAGVRFFKSDTATYFCVGWDTEADYTAYLNEVTSQGLDVLFDEARDNISALLGLTSYKGTLTGLNSLDDLTFALVRTLANG